MKNSDRKEAKLQRKRKRIMGITRQLIVQNGYAKTSLEEVANRAEVSKATIYQLFKSKEGLLTDILLETASRLNAIFVFADETDRPIREVLIEYAIKDMRITHSARHVALMSAVISESRNAPSVGKHYFDSGPGRVLDFLADYFEKQGKLGVLRITDPRKTASHFLSLFHWESQLSQMAGVSEQPSLSQIEKDAEQGVDFFLQGYQVKT